MVRVLTLAVLLLWASVAQAQTQPLPPELTAPVNDFAGVIDRNSAAQLETLIRQLQNASGDVLVVATVPTFKPYADLQSYAVKMFENHGKGIGGRQGDGGALVVLAVEDRQVWVEVGYGLEGFITDGFAGETSRDTMVPFFRRGEYGQGLLAGATRVAQRIADGRNVSIALAPPRTPARPTGNLRFNPVTLLIILYVLYRLLSGGGPRGRGRGLRRRGGLWSSGVGPFGSIGGFGGFGGGRSGGGGGGASW